MNVRAVYGMAIFCYAIALAGVAAFGLFILLHGTGLWPFMPWWAAPSPWPVNLAWLFTFAIQHSGMVRAGFKRVWTRIIDPRLERSLYAGLSGLWLLALPAVWQPVSGEAWWSFPRALVVVPLAAIGAQAVFGSWFDHATLFGLRQAWGGETTDRLLVAGPYRFVRHPLYATTLVFLWTQPSMTPTLGVLVVGLTAYIALGVLLEERDLLRRFGPAYAAYRRRVPCLIPWCWPVPAGAFESRP